MTIKFYITGLLVILLKVSLFAGNPVQPLPNIIFILADDLGYGDVSCLNADGKIQTPNIDKLAAAGVTFTDAHSAAAVCTPTRYGILTGRYPWRSLLKQGVLDVYAKPLMDASRLNMASMLKEAGYKTACFGKWHLGFNWPTVDSLPPSNSTSHYNIDFYADITGGPVDLGFDYFFGMDAPNYPPYCFIQNRKVLHIPNMYFTEHQYVDCRPGIGMPDWKMEDVLPDLKQRTVDFITNASKKSEPFFLYFPITAPHTPIAPSLSYQGLSEMNAYADFVSELDDVVGEIMKTLEKTGISENTIVVFTSDNGCSPQADFPVLSDFGHNPSYIFRGQKADLFEGGHRVPCIVRWPAKVKSNQIVNQTICLNDFMATFAAVSNYQIQANEAEDSYNLLPLLLNTGSEKQLREATVHQSIDGSLAIRRGDWKLLMCAGSGGWSSPKPGKEEDGLLGVQLYNLKTDPGEGINVQAKYPEKVKELSTLLKKYIENGRSTSGTPQKNDGKYPWKQVENIFVK